MFQSASTTTQVNQRPSSLNELLVHIDTPLDKPGNALLKRGFDIVFSLLVVIFVLSWLTPILALLIKLDSRGPVFFIQERGGKNGKTFRCIKFRTMRHDSDKTFKLAEKDDPRITRIGAWLRKTSLDELPQFFNVLKGDMSVIGPRPHPIEVDKEYSVKIPHYMLRYIVKPGISGISQISGLRGRDWEVMPDRVKHDIYYIQNWSFWLDLKIILSTALKVVFGDKYAF